ncbi:MAG: YvcK family protein [Anaerolineales bacterium]|nr:YvcK family protein [Anaerolineales bacterium]
MAQRPSPPAADRAFWSQALRPGLGLKRWTLLGVIGVALIGLALTVFGRMLISHATLAPLAYWGTLLFMPPLARGAVLAIAGLALALFSIYRVRTIIVTDLWPDLQTPENRELLNAVMRRYQRRLGPRIVAIGGGTGMPQLLRGLRKYTDNITAIVTVADDGGSSGRLRRTMGMLPPGDFRNNIAALSDSEGLMTRLFQYRFAESDFGEPERSSELAGHSFGNLFITTMAAVTGSFEAGIAESSKVLRVRGRVLPSTLENVTLCGEVHRTLSDGGDEWVIVEGESNLPHAGGKIMRVFLKPEQPRAYPEAIRAILQADLIVAGPGSFYTSIIPNLLVLSVRDAICASPAPRIYICNVATQDGETDHFSVEDHMRKLQEHAEGAFPIVLANDNFDPLTRPSEHAEWVALPHNRDELDFQLFTGDVVDNRRPWRHDSEKLAARVMDVYAACRAAAPEHGAKKDASKIALG